MSESVCEEDRQSVASAEASPTRLPDGEAAAALAIDPLRLPRPEATEPLKIQWGYVISLGIVHLVALYALIPWFFTWSGLAVAFVGHLMFSMLGITVGYHRLLTHRGFTCPKWLEHFFATMGICTLQDRPARWVAIHRMHHQFSDDQPDPHSPLVNFLWGHVGWVVCRHRDLDTVTHYERYVRDLLRDPFYLKMERNHAWLMVYLAHALIIATLGAVVGYLSGGGSEALRYAASWTVWGVAVRTVADLHIAWSVNSLAHLFGYRNYETRDHSTNNWLVALLSHGEGWHNNHHAQPRAAAHGHRWWEIDMSWRVIRLLEAVGLAKDVVRPKQ